jgi:predicted Mrr-cat superfamily restriction endonuclease
MNYWLHRISYLAHVSYPLLNKGYLSIGFSDFSNEEFLNKVSEKDWNFFEEQFDKIWECRPRGRYNLWRFIAEMDKDDIVIVPNWWQSFSVYKIEEPCAILSSSIQVADDWKDWNDIKILQSRSKLLILDGEKDCLDLGFFRKVKPIAIEIPRYEYADAALTARMKIRQTNTNILDLKKSIEDAIKSFKNSEPINLKNFLVESSVEKWLKVIRSKMNASKFERLVKLYFERVGATSIEINPEKNSSNKAGDVDIIAEFEPIKTIINIQVKFYVDVTHEWPVQQIKDFLASKENLNDGYSRQYWVISTSDSFSGECIRLALEKSIILIDGKQFVRMLMDAGLQNIIDI